ncbi:pilus assembly protein PilM [Lonepinella koalarum]|uniref:Type IV pilus assembly PilM-like protein n=1 Tax=Lonepinella koalarum TaxID=53417 RepID=A0A4R1KWB1_9PAST|nr:pilus assembly protein PilM [Lonepinella koalarum]MDH2926528.1 hypothetical protein [Lonepinella koalarum]TCK69536.1 type IV pilus assembly PilM-like protein [Lonepinella koalarum]TFJ89781.1 hypothetical protein E0709_06550 [Lonepinella koalarum]
MGKLIKKNTTIQVGIWITKQYFELVWFAQDKMTENTPHFCRVNIDTPNSIQATLVEHMSNHINIQRPLEIKWVTAMLPHKVWSKSIILPHHLNENECDHQCRYILENELPIALDELWFDYMTTPLKQGLRLDIFAVRKAVGQTRLIQFLPLNIKTLDTAVHCLYRAFGYLFKTTPSSNDLFIYQDQQSTILFRQTPQEWQILSSPNQTNLTELYQQFVQRYEQNIDNILLYCETNNIQFHQPYQQVTSDIPLIPLGAALWQKDWQQNENRT